MNALWEQALALLWRRSRFTSYFYQSVSFMENHDIPTLALTVRTDGFCLYYHPGFIGSLGVEERIGLLVHEMLHVVFS
ncbi:MAG TPA: hypothetical protein ENN21_04165, partial [Spirochaetes bacterium]|nr:hypothetical protein [Spirochaetota bacterium]